VSGHAERSEARERALGLLYEAEAKGRTPAEVLDDQLLAPLEFAVELVEGVSAHQSELDAMIGHYSKGWTLERMAALDRAVLRIGTFELAHRPDVPVGVVLAEAVDLASRFSTEDSARFVNGLLGRISKEVRAPELAAEAD
jgi:N utilization substance protein B